MGVVFLLFLSLGQVLGHLLNLLAGCKFQLIQFTLGLGGQLLDEWAAYLLSNFGNLRDCNEFAHLIK